MLWGYLWTHKCIENVQNICEKENNLRMKPPSKEGGQEGAGKETQPYFNIQLF